MWSPDDVKEAPTDGMRLRRSFVLGTTVGGVHVWLDPVSRREFLLCHARSAAVAVYADVWDCHARQDARTLSATTMRAVKVVVADVVTSVCFLDDPDAEPGPGAFLLCYRSGAVHVNTMAALQRRAVQRLQTLDPLQESFPVARPELGAHAWPGSTRDPAACMVRLGSAWWVVCTKSASEGKDEPCYVPFMLARREDVVAAASGGDAEAAIPQSSPSGGVQAAVVSRHPNSCAWDPTRRLLYVGFRSGLVGVWATPDSGEWKARPVLRRHKDAIMCIVPVNATKRHNIILATACDDHTACLWNAEHEVIHTIHHTTFVNAMDVCRLLVATGDDAGFIVLTSLHTLDCLLSVQTASVYSLRWGEDALFAGMLGRLQEWTGFQTLCEWVDITPLVVTLLLCRAHGAPDLVHMPLDLIKLLADWLRTPPWV